MVNRSEVSCDTTAARDIGTVDNSHDEFAEVSDTLEKSSGPEFAEVSDTLEKSSGLEFAEVSDTLEKSSGLLFDKCRARM